MSSTSASRFYEAPGAVPRHARRARAQSSRGSRFYGAPGAVPSGRLGALPRGLYRLVSLLRGSRSRSERATDDLSWTTARRLASTGLPEPFRVRPPTTVGRGSVSSRLHGAPGAVPSLAVSAPMLNFFTSRLHGAPGAVPSKDDAGGVLLDGSVSPPRGSRSRSEAEKEGAQQLIETASRFYGAPGAVPRRLARVRPARHSRSRFYGAPGAVPRPSLSDDGIRLPYVSLLRGSRSRSESAIRADIGKPQRVSLLRGSRSRSEMQARLWSEYSPPRLASTGLPEPFRAPVERQRRPHR